ncbi:MAG: molybdopterin-dependent oxidoreductase, partial [Rhodospirillales bacterium]|nr:molybdopterin-dependent oxidoreductase [Rhodospirillales bacterium]
MPDTSERAPLTQALAEFIGTFRPDALPDEVGDMTLLLVRDGAGALLAAANPEYSTGRLIADFAREHGGKAESTLIGQGTKTIFSQIASSALDIPYDWIQVAQPDTAAVPDSGPTVASRTT